MKSAFRGVDQDETFVDDGGEDDKKMGAGAKGARRTSGSWQIAWRKRHYYRRGSSGVLRGNHHQS
jgi:hypothetical protein